MRCNYYACSDNYHGECYGGGCEQVMGSLPRRDDDEWEDGDTEDEESAGEEND